MAAANHKLTTLIAGRTISAIGHAGDLLTLTFSDDSTLTASTAPGTANDAGDLGANGKAVEKVRQSVEPSVLYMDLADGSSLEVQLAEATSSVMVRGSDGEMEYAD